MEEPHRKPTALSPAQQQAHDWFASKISLGNIFHCHAKTGRGRSTVLRELHRRLGGALITIRDFVEASHGSHPLALEDVLCHVTMTALKQHDLVIVDDLHVATAVMSNCSFYPRSGWLDAPMTLLATYAVETDKKLLLGTNGQLPDPLRERCYPFGIGAFAADDYRHLYEAFLGADRTSELDFEKIHRFAPKLNAHQLKSACCWWRQFDRCDTDAFIEYLRSQELISNVTLGEVTQIELSALKGVDDIIKSLEANIALPLENGDLANQLGLKPKRGVLLVGPPGTGKTTVGRALAHRLKGKFFLVDGTFISGTEHFYSMVHRVFEAAKDNAPSVIFIDDSDVIFESGQEHGLYRYLLTMLDGLESESAGRVCVMMTAMDVGNLPPALVRSGRIELWLEMRLPDDEARAAIFAQHIDAAPEPLNGADVSRLVEATADFTGADIKRTCEDGKALYAYDRVAGITSSAITEYYLNAARTVGESKHKYAEAEARANASRPTRPAWFNPNSHVDFLDAGE